MQRALRAYRAGFFEALRDELAQGDIHLDLYESTPPPDQDPRDDPLEVSWAVHLPARRIRLRSRELVWQPLPTELQRAHLVIVEQAADLALNYRLLLRQQQGKSLVAFWGHGRSFAPDASPSAEKVKSWASRQAHWWFAYTERAAEAVEELGFDRERITVVNNTIDAAPLERGLATARAAPGSGLRDELLLGHGPVGLFIGTLREDKRIDVLLDAAERIHAAREDFRLLIVGSGPMEDEIRARATNRPWLHYLGPRYGADRAEALAISDVLLIPGWVGLAVIDSFVAGVPLITSRDQPHPPEIAYLRDGENGLFVEDGGNPERYADAVSELLADPSSLGRLRDGCITSAAEYGLEAMVARFADGIRRALAA